ncbi:uncharacterized protein LOC130974583 [Arachis stenosperma]|uniref:uncharacterized protein LOC130974583 n=1 Tax=Arachis stenosperma TaxID=217475 RepID=UPI0025AD35A2|nr:uncharacterized protein LOC130974583 [Arachis stenosperma]
MPYPEVSDVRYFQNKLIEEELAYDTNELTHINLYTEQKMTHEQRSVFDEILNAVITDSDGFYFVYGYRGCGKAFIWNELSSAIRSRGKIILNVASSGIASLLLPGGRTDNSRFSTPITITDESTCNIKHGSLKAELFIQSSLIIWDEAPMLNKMCSKALDRTIRDLMSVANQHKHNNHLVILNVGNENIGSTVGDESEVNILDDQLITTVDDPFYHLVDFAYLDLL